MPDDIAKRILHDSEYDSEREESLRRFVSAAFEARTRVLTFIVGLFIVVFSAIAVWVAILFFRTDEVRYMILYSTVFTTCIVTIAAVRIFLWQLLHRQRVLREIKRLELRIVTMTKPSAATPKDD
jgi:Na+/H+-dicarboxylate symporter